MIKDLSDQIHDPVLIFDSSTKKDGAYVLVTEMMHKGDPVIVAFHLNKTVNGYLVNEIASSYEKRNSMAIFFNKWIAKEGLLRYQNTSKVARKGWEDKIKKSLDDWRLSRLQLPGGAQTSDFNDILLTQNDIVKSEFLIGKLNPDRSIRRNRDLQKFQFLIGKLNPADATAS